MTVSLFKPVYILTTDDPDRYTLAELLSIPSGILYEPSAEQCQDFHLKVIERAANALGVPGVVDLLDLENAHLTAYLDGVFDVLRALYDKEHPNA